MFCAPGTKIVELLADLRHRPLCARTATAAGCDHGGDAIEFHRAPADLTPLARAIQDFAA